MLETHFILQVASMQKVIFIFLKVVVFKVTHAKTSFYPICLVLFFFEQWLSLYFTEIFFLTQCN